MPLPSGVVTLLFTDIEGSTRLLERLGGRYAEILAAHLAILRAAVTGEGGCEVDTQGDALFAVFASARSAVRAVAGVQRDLAGYDWGDGVQVRVRMGLDTGRPVVTEEGYVGMVVHRAARICAAAYGGQVVLSQDTFAELDGCELAGCALRDLGEHALKDIPDPVKLCQLVVPGLGEDFPPLRSAGGATNLPPPGPALIGREDELRTAVALVGDQQARLVTLTGTGGVGKTRLALQVAARLLESSPGGVFFVDLTSTVDASVIRSAIAAALGSSEDALTGVLRDRKAVLVLDNLEQLRGAEREVASLLAEFPLIRVLATSRAPLGLRAEQELRVAPLSVHANQGPAPAVELFLERARSVVHDFAPTDDELGAVAEVCARLDGLPLAIELAAARVRVLPPKALLRRLEKRLDVLTKGPADLPERHRKLEATIAWSHDLLPEPEQKLFARLAVFPGSWTLEGAEAVCADLPDVDALDVVEALVANSLVVGPVTDTGEAPRFSMLQTVREFALARLEAAGQAQPTRKRMAEFHRSLTLALGWQAIHGHEQSTWLARLDAELVNLRATMSWAQINGQGDLLLALAAALWPYMELRGMVREARDWLEEALEGTSRPSPVRILALAGACGLAAMQGDAQAAEREREELERLLPDVEDRGLKALALMALSFAADLSKEYDLARSRLRESADLARGVDDPLLAAAMSNLADVAMRQGRLQEACEVLHESLSVTRRVRDPYLEAFVIGNIATVLLALRDVEAAERSFADCLERAQALGDRRLVISALHGLAWCAAHRDDAERAARTLGCADRQRELDGERLSGLEAELQDQAQARLRDALGAERLTELWEEGRGLSLQNAVAYGLRHSVVPATLEKL